jgi:ABC-type sugar transport system permease subunit
MVAESWLPRSGLGRAVLLGALFFFGLMVWWPIFQTFWLSLQFKRPGEQYWVGLENFRFLLFEDPLFWKSLSVTFLYVALTVPGVVIFGLFLAVVLNGLKSLTLRGFFTSLYFVPFIVPLVAVALVWRYMYLPGPQGLLNTVLAFFDLGPIRWLNSSDWALPSLAILRVWKISGYAMVLFLAGLQSIPAMFYEAAAIDGANAWHRFWRITLPLLMPTMAFVIVITTIGAMLEFTTVYTMTTQPGVAGGDRGGPNFATYVMSYHIFKTAITNQYEGLGSANAAIFFCIMVAIGYLQYRFLKIRHEY